MVVSDLADRNAYLAGTGSVNFGSTGECLTPRHITSLVILLSIQHQIPAHMCRDIYSCGVCLMRWPRCEIHAMLHVFAGSGIILMWSWWPGIFGCRQTHKLTTRVKNGLTCMFHLTQKEHLSVTLCSFISSSPVFSLSRVINALFMQLLSGGHNFNSFFYLLVL